jgi:glycosyltransferase involved in cell wall biosynthesis
MTGAVPRRPRLVSVVVPVRDERMHLEQQLEAVAAQDYSGPWELVISDDGSRDGSLDLANRWTREHGRGTVVASAASGGPGAARNAGARAARGDLLAFADSDDVVARDWLTELVAAAAGADVVGGSHDAGLLNDARQRACHSVHDPHERAHGYAPVAAGANMAIWRDAFEMLGGFDESHPTGEDVALSWNAAQAGLRYTAAARALVHKRFAPNLRAVARQYYAYGRGDAWLFRRFGAAGMRRHAPREVVDVWIALLRGALCLPRSSPCDRRRLLVLAAVTAGRMAGSVRHRVLFF